MVQLIVNIASCLFYMLFIDYFTISPLICQITLVLYICVFNMPTIENKV